MRHLSDILAKAGLVVDGVVTLNNVANATIDTDKFLVIDSGVVKYRTGTQMLSDIGAAAAAAGLPPGGTAGQILAKIDATNYNAEWIDNYTSNVRHLVKLASAMTVGTPVYVSGSTGQSGTNMIVSPASNTSEATSSKTLGLLVTGGATNDIVFVVTEGLLAGLNTSSAAAGDPVWLGPNGTLLYGLINKPVAPVHMVFIGVVTRAQQNNGEIFVKVQNGYELEELHNVLITDVGDKHFLYRDGPTNLWKNASISTILGYTPANSTSISGTVNRVAKFTSASAVGDSQIFDNGTSVGVGTSSPTAKLDVSIGNINLSNAYYLSSRNAANTANLSIIGRNTSDRVVIDPDGYGTNIGGGGSVLINLAGGQVAIGTSSPVSGSVLDIAGSTNVYPRIRSTGTGEAFMFFQNTNSGTTAADGLFVGINSGNDAFFYNAEATPARFFTSAIERMRITASGNVGIGTASPASILHLRASSATFTIDDSGDGLSKISFRPSAASYAERAFISVNYTTAEMSIGAGVSGGAYFQTFYTNGTERLRIASNGNVGIGTTSPSSRLHVVSVGTAGNTLPVNASGIFEQSGNNVLAISGGSADEAGVFFPRNTLPYYGGVYRANDNLIFRNNDTERLRISSAGVITVANLAGSGARLVVADASGNLSATTLSSSVTTGSGTTNYITKWTGASALGNSQIFDNGTNVGIGTASPLVKLDIVSSAGTVVRTKGGTGSAQGSAYYVQFAASTNTLSAFGDRANIFGGTVDQIASIYTGSGIPLTFDVNTAERMRVTAGGRVGIGTASPNYFVEAYQNGLSDVIVNSAADNNSAILSVFNSGGTSGNFAQLRAYGNTTASTLFGSSTNKMISLFSNGDALMTLGTISATPLVLGTTNTERLRITSSGDVGIGTGAGVLDRLTIYKDENATTTTRIRNIDAGASAYTQFVVNSFGNSWGFRMGSFAANSNALDIVSDAVGTPASRMRIFTNGRIGINTTTDAGYQLDVAGTLRATGQIRSDANFLVISAAPTFNATLNTADAQRILIYMSGTDGVLQVTRAGGTQPNMVFSTEDGEKMRITSAGNIGVGTTTPAASARLDVTSTTQGFLPPRMTATQRAAITSPAVGLVVYQTDGNEGLWIYTNANGWKALAIVV